MRSRRQAHLDHFLVMSVSTCLTSPRKGSLSSGPLLRALHQDLSRHHWPQAPGACRQIAGDKPSPGSALPSQMPHGSEPPEKFWTPQTTCGAFELLRLEAFYADPAPTLRPSLW